jgi:uncharacterized protein (TIGR00730 family)
LWTAIGKSIISDDAEKLGEEKQTVVKSVCVYCASSRQCDALYIDAARRLGQDLAHNGIRIVYGGGSTGLMGSLADGALAGGGAVIGVLPRFMYDVEWGHREITELRLVDDMHERKRLMLDGADGVVALPGGCGTLEELLEAITWKRLGLYTGPVVLVNMRGFFDSLIGLLERCVAERFMDPRHLTMWTVVSKVEDVLEALRTAPSWSRDARSFATL